MRSLSAPRLGRKKGLKEWARQTGRAEGKIGPTGKKGTGDLVSRELRRPRKRQGRGADLPRKVRRKRRKFSPGWGKGWRETLRGEARLEKKHLREWGGEPTLWHRLKEEKCLSWAAQSGGGKVRVRDLTGGSEKFGSLQGEEKAFWGMCSERKKRNGIQFDPREERNLNQKGEKKREITAHLQFKMPGRSRCTQAEKAIEMLDETGEECVSHQNVGKNGKRGVQRPAGKGLFRPEEYKSINVLVGGNLTTIQKAFDTCGSRGRKNNGEGESHHHLSHSRGRSRRERSLPGKRPRRLKNQKKRHDELRALTFGRSARKRRKKATIKENPGNFDCATQGQEQSFPGWKRGRLCPSRISKRRRTNWPAKKRIVIAGREWLKSLERVH